MRRRRYQHGSVKRKGRSWVGQWWEQGHRRNKVLGKVSAMTKSEAKGELSKLLEKAIPVQEQQEMDVRHFVEQIYYPFYTRKWKRSTADTNINRVDTHVISVFSTRLVASFKRDELQDFLDAKSKSGLSFSVLSHLRWDLKQIFDLAVAEGLLNRNPATLLFVPRGAPRGERRVLTLKEVQVMFAALDQRERIIAKLATLAGMRPGEIFALTWGKLASTHADIRQRVYRGLIDSPKTVQSVRRAALTDGLAAAIECWRAISPDTRPDAWVFPSERGTPLSRDNCMRRHIAPRLAAAGLGWVTFQVMRRSHSSLLNALGVEGKLVADQLGHGLDVNQNVYTQTSVDLRRNALHKLEAALQTA